jgi:hypothetical protein
MPKFICAGAILAVILASAMVVCANSHMVFWGWTPQNIEKSKSAGNLIIEEIERFAEANGHFPGRLDELVPKYLKSIPPPSAGEKCWRYAASEKGDNFELTFCMPMNKGWRGYPSCFFVSSYGSWYLDE